VKITILAYVEAGAQQPDVAIEQVQHALDASGHETSLLTVHDDVSEIIAGLQKPKPDLIFNLLECFAADIIGGQMGVAGVLDLLQIPYTGGGPGELYLQEDKALAKKLLAYEQVLSPDFATFAPNAEFETGGNLRMPLFVKPLRMDASLGIDERSVVRTTQELMERVAHIQRTFGDAALAEEYIEGREFYVAVLGNVDLVAFPPIEMDFSGLPDGSLRIMDNAAKFDESSERFHGTRAVLANIDSELAAYRALRVRDYGRIDLRLAESGEIYVIEVNANCYLERNSEFATAAAAHGIEYNELINRIAQLAIDRRQQILSIKKKRKKKAAPAAKKDQEKAEKKATKKGGAKKKK